MEAVATIRCYDDFVRALRARQAHLALSDATLDEVAGLTAGHTNKCLGPSRERGIGAATFEAYLMALAIDLVMVENAEKLAVMQAHYEERKGSHVRTGHAIGDRVLSRAMTKLAKDRWAKKTPEERRRVGKELAEKRFEGLTTEERSEAARFAANRRWGGS